MKQRELTESSLVIEAKLFLLRLDSEAKKTNDINYDAIHKNIEFCSGLYENIYGGILKELDKFKTSLLARQEMLEEGLREERMQHIQTMENL